MSGGRVLRNLSLSLLGIAKLQNLPKIEKFLKLKKGSSFDILSFKLTDRNMEIDDISGKARKAMELQKKYKLEESQKTMKGNNGKGLIGCFTIIFIVIVAYGIIPTIFDKQEDSLNSIDYDVSGADKWFARKQSENILEPILEKKFIYVNFIRESASLQNFGNGMWVLLGKFRGPREDWGRIKGVYRFEFIDDGKGKAFITGINCVWLERGKEFTMTIFKKSNADYHYWFKYAEDNIKNSRENKLSKVELFL